MSVWFKVFGSVSLMSDQDLRQLELNWKRSGETRDKVSYLLEKLRIGDVLPTDIELAAFLGDEASRKVLNSKHFKKIEEHPLTQSIERLAIDHDVSVRALVAIGRSIIETSKGPVHPLARDAIASAEKWLADQSEESRLEAHRISERCQELYQQNMIYCVETASDAAYAASLKHGEYEDKAILQHAVWSALDGDTITEEFLIESIRECLVPWILGTT